MINNFILIFIYRTGNLRVALGWADSRCAAAVRAVLEALGKKAGPEDDRAEPKRFHDALQLAWQVLPRAARPWPDVHGRGSPSTGCSVTSRVAGTLALPHDRG